MCVYPSQDIKFVNKSTKMDLGYKKTDLLINPTFPIKELPSAACAATGADAFYNTQAVSLIAGIIEALLVFLFNIGSRNDMRLN